MTRYQALRKAEELLADADRLRRDPHLADTTSKIAVGYLLLADRLGEPR